MKAEIMKPLLSAVTILAILTAVFLHGQEQETTAKDVQSVADGFYYKAPDGLKSLQPISMAGGGMKHVGKMLVPGLTPQMVWTFRGAEAPIQITERRPTFYVKQSPMMNGIAGRSERDLAIIRFDKKKDHRELQTTSGGSVFTFKSGISKERLPDIIASKFAEGIFAVTPKEDLPPGEYLITFSSLGISGCDFGIKQEKR
ncbi:MAG: hypothetical protein ACHP7I_01195 [Terriglobales bacterium]